MLDLNWVAVPNEGADLKQFDGENENLFGQVEAMDLKEFKLVDQSDVEKARVVLASGEVFLNGESQGSLAGGSCELIYIRRNQAKIIGGAIQAPRTQFIIGVKNAGGEKGLKIIPASDSVEESVEEF